jgi:hypothetical protein
MKKNIKTIRLSELELKEIEEFLSENKFFDFSTLARAAIGVYIRSPKMDLRGIKKNSVVEERRNVYK